MRPLTGDFWPIELRIAMGTAEAGIAQIFGKNDWMCVYEYINIRRLNVCMNISINGIRNSWIFGRNNCNQAFA